MNKPVVLAFAGGLHASAASPWLIDTMGVEVVTVTLDVGQGHELGELRARALDCGALDIAEVARVTGLTRADLEGFAAPRRGDLTASAK